VRLGQAWSEVVERTGREASNNLLWHGQDKTASASHSVLHTRMVSFSSPSPTQLLSCRFISMIFDLVP
jgi:hypothetical protein